MNAPIPRDIPLPLPAGEGLLEFLLIVSFIVHIVFVHLMLGGSIFSLICQIKGLKTPDFEKVAYAIMRTITVNKSLAVVMGVAPLLLINTLYAPQFYASSALIGDAWMSVVPLVTIAFLIAYAHKFWWNHFVNIRELHIGIALMETLLFLTIPLIFMTNVNLMLFPERWPDVKGFFSAMLLPNVIQRYLHFVTASVLFGALFLVWLVGRRGFVDEVALSAQRIAEVRRFFYVFAFGAVIVQILTGLIVLVSLPANGMSWEIVLLLLLGGGIALPAIGWMWQDLQDQEGSGFKYFNRVVLMFVGSVVIMGMARHEYRENALADHKTAIALKTANYQAAVTQARNDAEFSKNNRVAANEPSGAADFKQYCSACHHPELPTVGPALQEIKDAYAGNPEGIAAWTKAPGKKRPDSMRMPGFPQLSDQQLMDIANYMLDTH
ncbi:c-type cytochrome [Methylomonas albis]|uniref:Cytochrome c n=1 Tax=Methylomonas albis TaxID=1854563 RepID=A0ABR9CXB5_9GAMM|nr:cytochrome c [Methylomonas albis]MBD9355166.1 cytochrome c [Methylomonas albis]